MKKMRIIRNIQFLLFFFVVVSSSIQAKDYTLLLADHSQKHLFIRSSNGEIVWKHPGTALFEAWVQKDGSIVYCTRQTVEKIIPDFKNGEGGELVWKYSYGTGYTSSPLPKKGMIYTCLPLNNGNFLVTESGTFRLLEINDKGEIVHIVNLPQPKAPLNMSLRLTRYTEQHTYLVSYFGEGKILELDRSGKQIREINIGQYCNNQENSAYEAIPLKNGRLLVSCGPENQIIILSANGKVEWKMTAEDLPSDMDFGWITKITPRKNGNIMVCNYFKGKAEIKAFEITPSKEIVWKLTDPHIKGLTSLQLLSDDYKPLSE